MTTTDSVSSASQTPPASGAGEESPKFEQTMKGLLDLLTSLPRDGAVTHAMLRDWVLPLFEDARDEYHALAADNADEIVSVAEAVAEATPSVPDESTRQIVMALAGLVALVMQRARWMDDKLVVTALCPKDLAEEYTKVQTLAQAWAAGIDVAAVAADGGSTS